MRLDFGISTCPNDTYTFFALLKGRIKSDRLDLVFRLADVEELNRLCLANRLHYSKASFATALKVAESYGVLPAGSALGFGVGPVIVAPPAIESLSSRSVVLAPGANTTAVLLFRRFYPEVRRIEQAVFSEIMPAVQAGKADAGLVIHEGRFTYENYGLKILDDLGARWETATQLPLPLGGILGSLALGSDVHSEVADLIRRSLEYARSHPSEAEETMREYAQEMDTEVLWKHVDLYVNEFTSDLGSKGRTALQELTRGSNQQVSFIPTDPVSV